MRALHRTMGHLRGIMDARGTPLVNVHKFLWDRYRGVRQDLFVQGFEARPLPSLCMLCHYRTCPATAPAALCVRQRTWLCSGCDSLNEANTLITSLLLTPHAFTVHF